MSRRHTVGAIYTNYTTVSHPTANCHVNISSFNQVPNLSPSSCQAELDSHADTCGVNDVAKILYYTGKTVQVSAYSPTIEKLENIPIVTAAMAYDDAVTGESYIVLFHQALYFGQHLKNILLNLNQIRVNGVQVEDAPKHLTQGKSSHSIKFPQEDISIPLSMHGCLSYFTVRTPTEEEINQCLTLTATAENLEWNQYSDEFAQNEASYDGSLRIPMTRRAMNYISSNEHEIIDTIQEDMYCINAIQSSKPQLYVQPEELAHKWAIGKVMAEDTIKATTQKFIRRSLHPIDRRYRTRNTMLKSKSLNCSFTFFASTRSLVRNTCGQLFISDFGFGKFCPQRLKSEAGYSLQEFLQDVGIPRHLHTDAAKEMTLGTWSKVCKEAGIKTSTSEPYSPWQNRTEVEIRELKRHVRRLMARTKTPTPLWDFCTLYATDLRNRLARPLHQLHGCTPYEMLTGNTPDISEFLEYEWYQPVWYFEPTAFPNQRKILARWIGVAHRVGQAMCYWLLPQSGIPITRTTVQPLSTIELQTDDIKEQLRTFDATLGDKIAILVENPNMRMQLYREDEVQRDDNHDDDDTVDQPTLPELDMHDKLLLTEPTLLTLNGPCKAKIIARKRDQNGNLIGNYDANPMINTRVYIAEFHDGSTKEYAANVIAEAIYNQVMEDGYDSTLFSEIIGHDHNQEQEQEIRDEYLTNLDLVPGARAHEESQLKRMMDSWHICIGWKDGSSSWHPLAEVKNSHPVHLAEYAERNKLQELPVFKWWAKHTLRQSKRLIASITARYAKRTYKFGIQVPNSTEEALAIDKATKTTFWFDAIQKEMKNVKVAFQPLGHGASPPVG
jgi:hypothetical protein